MRHAFTFIEVMVAGAVLAALLGAVSLVASHGRRVTDAASQHLAAREQALLALHRLRRDLRALLVLPGKPADGWSLRTSADRKALRFRRMFRVAGEPKPGVVEYRLAPAGAGRFHLTRAWWTDAAPAPRTQATFRAFVLTDATFLILEDDAAGTRVLHVALEIVDGARRALATHVCGILRPEAEYEAPGWFAEPFGSAEVPPGEVIARPARPVVGLEAPEDL